MEHSTIKKRKMMKIMIVFSSRGRNRLHAPDESIQQQFPALLHYIKHLNIEKLTRKGEKIMGSRILSEHGREIRQQMLQYIVSYIEEHGYPPTYREIGDAVGLGSSSSVYTHIMRMFREGTLETDVSDGKSTARAIRVPGYAFRKE